MSYDLAFPAARIAVLVRGIGGEVRLDALRAGEPATLTAARVRLLDPSGALIAEHTFSGALTAPLTHTFDAAVVPATRNTSPRYALIWRVTESGSAHEVVQQVVVAPHALYRPASVDDLLARAPRIVEELRGDTTSAKRAALDGYIADAWTELLERLWSAGVWPDQIVSSTALREPLRSLAAMRVFADLDRDTAGSAPSRWRRAFDDARATFEASWPPRVERDLTGDGVADTDRQTLGEPVVQLANAAPLGARARARFDPRF